MRADEVEGLYRDLTFPEPPEDRPYIYLNMVMSLDGKATIEGTERGLGSPRDQRLMRELRVHADMVMNGANTLRISGTSSTLKYSDLIELRRQRAGNTTPKAAIITQSADLPLEKSFFTSDKWDATIFVIEGAPADRVDAIRATGRRIVMLPDSPTNLHEMARIMRQELGVRYLLVEGGPTLNHGLFRQQLVDELFLTVSGKMVAGRNLAILQGQAFPPDELPQLKAISHHYNEDDHEFYFRWQVTT
jgi:2,5-diamino-6-(ribosylamino)-4(3H)-pyrimidinone 5'-phosphate reductase